MKQNQLLTDKEMAVLNLLANAWNAFAKLEKVHASDRNEFAHAIHAAQNIIMARPAARELSQLSRNDDA